MAESARNPKRPVANFDLAFTPGHCFQRDEWQYRMEVKPIADLCLPTGRIVAADPGNLDNLVEWFFTQVVPPGTYPVDLAIRHTSMIGESGEIANTACMRVRFKDAAVAEWVMATTKHQNPDDLGPFEIHGYGVDVGMGSFADSSGLVAILNKYAAKDKTLCDEFYFEKVLPAYEKKKGLYANIILDPATGANLIVCRSGHGDGCYASYWGLDRKGKPVCLVTDFGILTRLVFEKRELGPLTNFIGRERRLKLPVASLRLRMEKPNRRKLVIQKNGPGSADCDLQFFRNGERVCEQTAMISYGERGQSVQLRFEQPIPEDAVVVITYRDRIEPL